MFNVRRVVIPFMQNTKARLNCFGSVLVFVRKYFFTLLAAFCEFKINGGKMPIGVSLQRYSSLVLGIIFQAFSRAPVN